MNVNGTPNFFRHVSVLQGDGTFKHVFRDKLIRFTLINKIDHIVKISETSVLTEIYICIVLV